MWISVLSPEELHIPAVKAVHYLEAILLAILRLWFQRMTAFQARLFSVDQLLYPLVL